MGSALKEKFNSPAAIGTASRDPVPQPSTAPLIEANAGRAEYTPARPADHVGEFLGASKLQFRRIKRLKELFVLHQTLTRSEVAHIMQISPITAARDLKQLADDRFITRVTPSRSRATHYFEINKSSL